MKFSVGDIVKIRGTGKRGTIIQCENREIIDQNGYFSIERYFVKTEDASFPDWYHVSLLQYEKMDPTLAEKINKMLIDVHLKYRQFNVVKGIVEQNKNK